MKRNIAQLEKEWGEDPAVVALDAAGRMVRNLVNPDSGSWSLLVSRPGGLTCLVMSGGAWEPMPSTFDPDDHPASMGPGL